MRKALFWLLLFNLPAWGQQVWLSLSANGSKTPTLYQGWPLLLKASASLAGGTEARLEWPAPLRLGIADSQGKVQTWPLENLGSTVGPFVLHPGEAASTVWGLSADVTAALSEGVYTLSLEHPSTQSARRVFITVAKAPDSLPPDEEVSKGMLEARFAEFRKDLDGALKILDNALSARPDNIDLLSQKADVLSEMGRFEDAIVAVTRALSVFAAGNPDESPRQLWRQWREITEKAGML